MKNMENACIPGQLDSLKYAQQSTQKGYITFLA